MENISPSPENVTPVETTPATRPTTPAWRLTRLGRFVLAGVAAVVIVAALAIPRRGPELGTSAPAAGQPLATQPPVVVTPASAPLPAAAAMTSAAITALPDVAPQVMESSNKAAESKAEKKRLAASRKSAASNSGEAPLPDASGKDDGETTVAAPEPLAATPIAETVATTTMVSTVTLTGCLEINVNEDRYRLINTEGVEAPKSRSWRTGFLKKRSAPIALIEPPDPQGLQMQVGKRVSATGVLTSHELKVSSLRVVGSSCD